MNETTALPPFLKCPKVVFAEGAIAALPAEIAELGISNPMLLTDQGLVQCGVFDQALAALGAAGEAAVFDDVPENPTVAGVERAYRTYRAAGCDGVVAVGGGSVIDTAKATALLAREGGVLGDYLDQPGRLARPTVPLIAVPTTAGTGSESSPGAGIHPASTSVSQSLGSPFMIPRVAICDPELTLTLPPGLTAGTGMDALSHCVEGYLSVTENPLLELVALDGMGRVYRFLERAVEDGRDREARRELMLAAREGGMSISMGLGPAHALANSLGDRGLHHGTLASLALPAVLRGLLPHVEAKLERVATALGLPSAAAVAGGIAALHERVGLPTSLAALGTGGIDSAAVAATSARSHFNRRSAWHPSAADYAALLSRFYG